MEKVGLPNPLPSFLRLGTNPFFLDGKIQAQGIALIFRQAVTHWLQFGFSTLFLNVHSRQEFFYNTDATKGGSSRNLQPGTLQTIEDARREMFDLLCLRQNDSGQSGIGDFDVYARFTMAWEYLFKFRRIQTGLSIGGLLPSGQSRDIYEPTSVPFGGSGHWGTVLSFNSPPSVIRHSCSDHSLSRKRGRLSSQPRVFILDKALSTVLSLSSGNISVTPAVVSQPPSDARRSRTMKGIDPNLIENHGRRSGPGRSKR